MASNKYIAWTVLALFIPVLVGAFIFHLCRLTWIAGDELAQRFDDWLEDSIDGQDD